MIYLSILIVLKINLIHLTKGTDILLCASSDAKVDISCESDKVLVIEWVEYGRQDTLTCVSHDMGTSHQDTDCRMSTALALIQQKCFQKKSCNFLISKLLTPDPCPGTSKYLKARYKCVQESEIVSICESYYLKNKKSGYLISPNYPHTYNPDEKCTSEFIQHSSLETKLELLDLEMEARTTKGCYDWLHLQQKDSPAETYNYCGTMESIQEPKLLSFKNAVVSFLPDQMNEYRGFLIKFEATASKQAEKSDNDAVGSDEKLTMDKIKQLKGRLNKLKELRKQKELEQKRVKEVQEKKQRLAAEEIQRKNLELEKQKKDQYKEFVKSKNEQSLRDGCVKEKVRIPQNGYILSYKESKRVHIECKEGYTIDDEDNGLLVCHNGIWAGNPGKCTEKTCVIPHSPEHGEVIYRKMTVGSDIEYICHTSYVLIGERTLTCQTDGQWSGFEPHCTEGGNASLSLFGEFIVACILASLFVYFKRRCWPLRSVTIKSLFAYFCKKRT